MHSSKSVYLKYHWTSNFHHVVSIPFFSTGSSIQYNMKLVENGRRSATGFGRVGSIGAMSPVLLPLSYLTESARECRPWWWWRWLLVRLLAWHHPRWQYHPPPEMLFVHRLFIVIAAVTLCAAGDVHRPACTRLFTMQFSQLRRLSDLSAVFASIDSSIAFLRLRFFARVNRTSCRERVTLS